MATLIYLGFAGVLGYDGYLYSKGLTIGFELQAATGVLGFLAMFYWRSAKSRALAVAGKIPQYYDLKKR